MSEVREIFVRLLNEGVDAWRPIQAECVHGNVYTISDQRYNREIETWQFGPGEKVVCELIESSEGQILAATKHA
jgi:hypothetical protein